MGFLTKVKEKFAVPEYDNLEKQDYVELDTDPEVARSKVMIRPFMLKEFDDVKTVLAALREGHTISLVNIKPLKDKDLVELKRAINKLKKTTDAVEGEIAGFGEDFLVVTPGFATIYRTKQIKDVQED